jgi:hypothetical protein
MPLSGPKLKKPQIARLVALAVVALMAAAIVGWSILWFAASRETGAVLTAWVNHEAQIGRNWNCPERRIGGYPFDIEITCANPQFHGSVLDATLAGSLRRFHATATIFRPGRVIANVEAPFVGKTSDGALDVALKWGSLNLEIEGGPDALTSFSIVGAGIEQRGIINGQDATAHIEALYASLTPTPERAQSSFDFQINLDNASVPALNSLLALIAPLSIALRGTMTQADVSLTGKLENRVEQWRVAGGKIDLKSAALSSGDAKLGASGALDLDGAHRIRGNLDATIAGLNPILSRLGIDPRLLTASSLLTSFFGNSTRGEGNGPGATHLPLKIADGWLSVGPIRTPVRLPPLY